MGAGRWVLGLALLMGSACGPSLPSDTALGVGPGAEPEKPQRSRVGDKTAEGAESGAADESSSVPADTRPDRPKSGSRASGTPRPTTSAGAAPGEPRKADERPLFFEGLYGGLYEATVVLRQGSGARKRTNPRAKVRVERPSDAAAELLLLDADSGSPFCTLTVQVEANDATIPVGTAWTGPPEHGELSASITSGTAKVEARRLVIDLEAEVQSKDGKPASGKLRFHFHGWRPLE